MGCVKDSRGYSSRWQGPVRFGLLMLAWGGAAGAWAQPAPAPAGAAEPAAAASAPTVLGRKVDERAVREAARPFRWILDAEASSRRSAGTAAVPAPAVAPVVVPGGSGAVAARAAPSPIPAPAPRSLPPEVTAGSRQPVSVPPQPEPPAVRPAPTEDTAVTPTMAAAAPAAAPAAGPPAAPPGPATAPVPVAETARPAVGSPARDGGSVAAAEPRPQLRVMVEPEVPDSLLRRRPRGGGNHRVTLDVDIGTDGRVREARVRETTLAALADPVREAVLAWVYAPLARAVTETVQLQIEPR